MVCRKSIKINESTEMSTVMFSNRLRYALLILKELKKNEQQQRWKERKKRQ